jgi:hypothetical protein
MRARGGRAWSGYYRCGRCGECAECAERLRRRIYMSFRAEFFEKQAKLKRKRDNE